MYIFYDQIIPLLVS